MKKAIFLVLLFLMSASNTVGADLKIVYVDLNKALNESDRGKEAAKSLEDMINGKKPFFMEKEKKMKKLDEELKKQSSVLTPESRKEKEDYLAKLYRDYQRMGKDFQEEVQKKEAELTQEIQKDLIDTVVKIGVEEGYSFILEKGASGLVYAHEQLDITGKLIKKYNESAKSKK